MTNLQNNNKDEITNTEIAKSEITSEENTNEEITLRRIRSKHSSNTNLSVSSTGKTRYKRRRKGLKINHKLLKLIATIFILLIIATVIIIVSYVFINNNRGKKEFLKSNKDVSVSTIEDAVSEDKGNTVQYKGDTYRFNEDLISIVLMGIDQSTLGSDIYGEAGQADAIYILTYDTKSTKCSLIPISRETMVDVKLYSASGKPMGYENMQLCLSYAYGDGKESSCTNTLDALSRLMYNLPLSNYIAMNWDAVEPLNDAIGGITLYALSDVKTEYTTINKDDYVTLSGKDAWSYVKYRDISTLNSNAERLERQKHYMTTFINKLIPLAEYDPTVVTELFGAAEDYIYSNMTEEQLTYIASDILPNLYSAKDIFFVDIAGETKQGEKHAEFYMNDESLYEAILRVFYLKDLKF